MKRVMSLLVALVMFMSLGLGSHASHIDENEEFLKHDLTESEKRSTSNDEYGMLDKELLDANFEINFQKGVERDKVVEAIIAKYTSKTLKASSVLKEDKVASMYEIIDILENVDITLEDEQKLVAYFRKYAPYSSDKRLIQYNESIKNDAMAKSAMQRSTYSRTAAIDYAHTWYDGYNTSSYPNLTYLGGDCANFVSQCIFAGGMTTDTEWYITKLNSNNPTPKDVDELNDSWDLADPSPWISAEEFEKYWEDRAASSEEFTGDYVYNNAADLYSKRYYKGDPVQILEKVLWWYEGYHTMIITAYDVENKDYLLSGHTSSMKDKSLNDIASRYTDSKYKFEFFKMK